MGKTEPKSSRKTWRAAEVNLVKGTLKERRAEDQRRADAWLKIREAELEAAVGRPYDGLDLPGMRELMTRIFEVTAPLFAEYDRIFAAGYPADFQKAAISVHIAPGGIPPESRNQVRRDATQHLLARHRFMVASIAGFATETVSNISMRATDNPEVQDVLARLAIPNATTPRLEPPGPAIGMLKRLLPKPEEWGFEGYASPILPAAPNEPEVKVLPAPAAKKK